MKKPNPNALNEDKSEWFVDQFRVILCNIMCGRQTYYKVKEIERGHCFGDKSQALEALAT